MRRSLKTGVTGTKPYLGYAQTPKTLCLACNQNTRWTTGNCGPRRDVLFTMGNATTTNSAVWRSRSQRCGALKETIPGLNLHLFFLRRLNVRGLKPCPGMTWNEGQVGRCRQQAAHDLRSWRPTRHARSNGPRRCGYVLSDRRG